MTQKHLHRQVLFFVLNAWPSTEACHSTRLEAVVEPRASLALLNFERGAKFYTISLIFNNQSSFY